MKPDTGGDPNPPIPLPAPPYPPPPPAPPVRVRSGFEWSQYLDSPVRAS